MIATFTRPAGERCSTVARRNGRGRWNCAIPLSNTSSTTFSAGSPHRDPEPGPSSRHRQARCRAADWKFSPGPWRPWPRTFVRHVDLPAGRRHPGPQPDSRQGVPCFTRLQGDDRRARASRRAVPDIPTASVMRSFAAFPGGTTRSQGHLPWRIAEQNSNGCCLCNDDSGSWQDEIRYMCGRRRAQKSGLPEPRQMARRTDHDLWLH